MIRIQKNTTFINVKQKKFCFIEDRIFFTEPIDDCEYFVTLDMHVTKKSIALLFVLQASSFKC